MTAGLDTGTSSRYEQDRSWVNLNAGGPIVANRVFFYGSYYRPEYGRDNQSNDYGELPAIRERPQRGLRQAHAAAARLAALNLQLSRLAPAREERPVRGVLVQHHRHRQRSVAEHRHRRGLMGHRHPAALATFKYTHFANRTQSRPDFIADVDISTAIGTRLDIASLDTQGRFSVPAPIAESDAPTTRSSSRYRHATATSAARRA